MRMMYIAAVCLLAILSFYFLSSNKDSYTMTEKKENIERPQVLMTTNFGDIKIELLPEQAPETVDNFLKYISDGHYENTIFHRVIDGFMVQGGGYTSDLKQKSTRKSIKNEADNGLSNKRGTVAMARTQEPDSATAQFFINVADNPFLDHRGSSAQEFGYCVFAKVVEGMEIVDKIKEVETQSQGPYKDLPAKPIEITAVRKM
jgi:cyclophilin family peptidyl-prolyl cis-trans isomerase